MDPRNTQGPFFFFLHHVSSLVVSDSFVSPWTAAPPGPSVLGIFQVRILQWIAISSSRASSQPRAQSVSPALARRFFTAESPGNTKKETEVLNHYVPQQTYAG